MINKTHIENLSEFYTKFNYIQAIKNEESGNSYNRILDFLTTSQIKTIDVMIEWVNKLPNTYEGEEELVFRTTKNEFVTYLQDQRKRILEH